MKNHNFRGVSVLASLVLGFGLNVGQAEPSAVVETRGFDLRKPQDVAALYARIERRAADVCKDASSPWMAGHVAFVKQCKAATIDDAIASANVAALTALHAEKVAATHVAQNRQE